MKTNHSGNEEFQNEELHQEENISQQEQCDCGQCEELEQKYNELNDTHVRLIAEFDNYRKRTIREKAELLKSAGESILVNILPLVDDFERALQAINNTENIDIAKEGVELIYNKFLTFLNQHGVKVMETENQPFDMDKHEAITTIPAPTEELKGKIVDCVSKGYTLNDKVIRFPKVVVGE